MMDVGPVLHADDVVAGKMSALYTRAEPRDFLDIDAALTTGRYTRTRLCELAEQSDAGFDLRVLADLFGMLERYPDRRFAGQGSTRRRPPPSSPRAAQPRPGQRRGLPADQQHDHRVRPRHLDDRNRDNRLHAQLTGEHPDRHSKDPRPTGRGSGKIRRTITLRVEITCPSELNGDYMIRLAAVLRLPPTQPKSSRMTPMARGEIASSG